MAGSHDRVVEVVEAFAADHATVRGVFISGSQAAGTNDAYSDLDLVVITHDGGSTQGASALEASFRGELSPVALGSRPIGSAQLLNLITMECLRADVLVSDLSTFLRSPRHGPLRPLLDRDEIAASLPPLSGAPVPRHDDQWLLALVEGVLRTLALLPMLVGRGELLRGQQHVQLLKQDLLDLLLFANGDPPTRRPGIWQWSDLNDRLPVGDRATVEQLPALQATMESIVSGHNAVTRIFLGRARPLVAGRQLEWPQALEDAVGAYLERHELPAL